MTGDRVVDVRGANTGRIVVPAFGRCEVTGCTALAARIERRSALGQTHVSSLCRAHAARVDEIRHHARARRRPTPSATHPRPTATATRAAHQTQPGLTPRPHLTGSAAAEYERARALLS